MEQNEDNFKNVYMMGFISFFTDVSSEMVFSILPVYILGLPGGSPAMLGLIEGIAESMSYILRAVSGVISDKMKRRKLFILIGYGLSNIAKPFFSLTSTVIQVLTIRVLDRVGKGIRTAPRDALISDSVPTWRQGEAFGLHRTLDQTGAIIGPLLATGVMMFLGWTVQGVFILSFLPGLAALFIILFGVKEIIASRDSEYKFLEGLGDVLRGRFLWLLLVVTVFSLGAFNYSFILLNAKDMGVGDALIPVVYAVVNVSHTIIAIPAGRLADSIGKEKVLTGGYAIFLVTSVLLYFVPSSISAAYLIALIYGVYVGVVETVQRALIPGYVEASLKGTAYGVYYLVVGVALFIANTVVGFLWSSYGLWASSLYSGGISLLALIGAIIFINKVKP